MKKCLLALLVGSVILTGCATSSSVGSAPSPYEDAKAKFHDRPAQVSGSQIVSVQPKIISDAECTKAFKSRNIPGKFAPYQTEFLNSSMQQIGYQPINDQLIAVFILSDVMITLPGKEPLSTPLIVSVDFNRETLTSDGEFYTYYCRGKVHGQR